MKTEKQIWEEIAKLTPEQAKKYKFGAFELSPEQQELLHFIAYPPQMIETSFIDGMPVDKETFYEQKEEE